MTVRILVGDAMEKLRDLPSESVQMCVTSPPYFGLRDYGVAGQLGLEKTPDEYIAKMVEVFREVRRVLRKDGTLWLNIGDSYAGSGNGGNPEAGKQATNRGSQSVGVLYETGKTAREAAVTNVTRLTFPDQGIKAKDLVGIPWMLAFALRADGWYLRSDIIWHKPNPMPESVTDRPTKAHEYVFLLSKSERYFYDADAIAEDFVHALEPPRSKLTEKYGAAYPGGRFSEGHRDYYANGRRNKRSVWTVATQPFKESHFATMPPELAETCIKAGSAKQACEHCGAPWERIVDRTPATVRSAASDDGHGAGRNDGGRSQLVGASTTTLGFAPLCSCENDGSGRSNILDPFGGAGTTGLVADRLERDAILCELNPEYAAMAERRIRHDNPMFAEVHVA